LEQGQTGTACRGEEHDIIIVWSLTSGKRQITMDGHEVHFSTNRSGVIDFSWSMRGNHVMKLIAHASPPLSATPGFRQYDLTVDGQSFFHMPKVFEIGVRGGPSQGMARSPGDYGQYRIESQPRGGYDEEREVQRAIQASVEESRSRSGYNGNPPAPAPAPAPLAIEPAADLLGFDSAPAPAYDSYSHAPPAQPPAAYGQPPPGALVPYGQPNGYGAPAPPSYAQAPPPAAYAQAPPPYAPAAYAPAPPAYSQAPFGSPQTYANGHNNFGSPDAQSFASAPNLIHTYEDPFAPKTAPPPNKYDIHNSVSLPISVHRRN
jgi:hypothetical protein